MMQAADRTIIVADSSKFGRSSLAMLCDWSRVHTLVSDDQLDSHWIKLAEQSQVILKIAVPSNNPPEYQSATPLPNSVLPTNNSLTTTTSSLS